MPPIKPLDKASIHIPFQINSIWAITTTRGLSPSISVDSDREGTRIAECERTRSISQIDVLSLADSASCPHTGLAKRLKLAAKDCCVVVMSNDDSWSATPSPSTTSRVPTNFCVTSWTGVCSHIIRRVARYRIGSACWGAASIGFPHAGLANQSEGCTKCYSMECSVK